MKANGTTAAATKMDRERGPAVLDALYELLGVNTPVKGINYREVARELLHIPEGSFLNIINDFERAGILSRSYKRLPGDAKTGKTARWTMLMERDAALKTLTDYWAKTPAATWNDSRPTLTADAVVVPEPPKVAVRTEHEEPVEAIAGPDAPKPFEVLRGERKDESAALIEAARQYGDRQNVIRRAFLEMEKQGIKVEWDKVNEAVHVDPDTRLDTIAQVLPYVAGLEKRVERLATDNAELRERLKGYDALKVERDKLREQNQRLLAERVGRQQAQA